ncbi:DUF4175 family protein [Hymenobacter sp. BT491]|uniref:DUF4175 family protein n=1 Tax=Hymenobacter sp. BT491 TaxID=2766779 RepID=UPI0016535322|nr:DUF4175 family protein [Hymenobacter sp. BT491]MBC6991558.1 hypothetical protein [Hymenobacter sp. BT491]
MSLVTQTSSHPAVAALRTVWHAYAGRRTVAVLLPAAAVGVLLAVVGWVWPAGRWAVGLLGAAGAVWLVSYLVRLWRPNFAALSSQLDQRYPVLENSTGLLLRDSGELNLLGHLQQQRVADRLQELASTESHLLPVSFRTSGLVAGLVLLAAALLWLLQAHGTQRTTATVQAPAVKLHFTEDQPSKKPQVLAQITETRIIVTPPAYTRRAGFAAAQPSFRCPEGSRIRWTVHVNSPATQPPQLEIGRQRLAFRAVTGQPTVFVAEQVVKASVLYRLRFAGRTSDDYAIDVQPDQAPVVQIQTPKPYTLVEFGQKPQVGIRVALRDDYGLTRARLVATVAQGQGEAVKFREVVTDLSAGLGKQPTQSIANQTLNLPKLGLTYGDEVYFYVQTWDNNSHTARSDTYLVQWEDTTVNEAATDISLGVNVVPAYFRSQRQIIIDTEKLLAERRSVEATAFSERSNNLGFDQKVLRLRYGKFLGEEFEQGLAETAPKPPVADADSSHNEHPGTEEEHEHGPPTADAANASPTAETDALSRPYMHLHDDEETADFLEPAVKAKLRGVLDQMWQAELRLRTVRPVEALPFEYRALRLLKQVQQQTRAYVKKSGYEPPVLPESTIRLTGELIGAAAPRLQQDVRTTAPDQSIVREALGTLQALRRGETASSTDAARLDRAGPAIAQAAVRRPGAYLRALRELRQLTTDIRSHRALCATCLVSVEQALHELLPPPPPTPTRTAGPDRLARRYFQELSR